MANVLTVLKIVPSETEFNKTKFITAFKKLCKTNNIQYLKYEEEPVAYGIVALLAYIKNPDSEDGADDLNTLQEALEANTDLSTVEVKLQQLTDH